MFPVLRQRIEEATEKLQGMIQSGGGNEEEIAKANEAVRGAKEALSVPV